MPDPKHTIAPKKATDLLKDGKALMDFTINGDLKIEGNPNWDKEIIFENCIISFFSGSVTQFEKPVRLINCHFKECGFVFSYFLGGLTIENCTFDSYLDFQAGGHNKPPHPVKISNNTFKGFVNFFDCWYESDVIIINNEFITGTNLLGRPHNIPVSFEIEPIIKDNIGKLDFDTEGL